MSEGQVRGTCGACGSGITVDNGEIVARTDETFREALQEIATALVYEEPWGEMDAFGGSWRPAKARDLEEIARLVLETDESAQAAGQRLNNGEPKIVDSESQGFSLPEEHPVPNLDRDVVGTARRAVTHRPDATPEGRRL